MSGNAAHDTLTRGAKGLCVGGGVGGQGSGTALLLLTAGTFNEGAFERPTVWKWDDTQAQNTFIFLLPAASS